jgi:hypothetical protein
MKQKENYFLFYFLVFLFMSPWFNLNMLSFSLKILLRNSFKKTFVYAVSMIPRTHKLDIFDRIFWRSPGLGKKPMVKNLVTLSF